MAIRRAATCGATTRDDWPPANVCVSRCTVGSSKTQSSPITTRLRRTVRWIASLPLMASSAYTHRAPKWGDALFVLFPRNDASRALTDMEASPVRLRTKRHSSPALFSAQGKTFVPLAMREGPRAASTPADPCPVDSTIMATCSRQRSCRRTPRCRALLRHARKP